MPENTYVMFGTDVVSCVYADQWNQSDKVDAPITGFVDASARAAHALSVYRPNAEFFSWSALAGARQTGRNLTVVYPKHHEEILMKQLAPYPSAFRDALQAIALPTPPDYVIEWQTFDGSFEEAIKLTEGYDSTLPTEHLVRSTIKLAAGSKQPLTEAQARQIDILKMLQRTLARSLRVVDFGGAAGANYHILPEALKNKIESWTVVETPEVVRQASQAFEHNERLHFVESLEDVGENTDYVLASSSLQYIPRFEHYFDQLLALNSKFLCIDRTPMVRDSEARVFLQRVHRENDGYSYETSYPLQPINKDLVEGRLTQEHDLHLNQTLHSESLTTGKDDPVPYYVMLGQRRNVTS